MRLPSLSGDDRALFASDIHLGQHDPETAEAFLSALQREAVGASHVFLLGDLFEVWVGDDQHDGVSERTIQALSAVSRSSHLWLMRGNRDFLLDVPGTGAPSFSSRVGGHMLEDPSSIELFGRKVLLMHGDALCIDDLAYQEFRAQARDPRWQRQFLAQALPDRVAIARALRQRSEHDKREKSDELMDVNAAEVVRTMRQAGAARLIHGHTHRPARHAIDPELAGAERWVLPDWDASAGRGGFLEVSLAGWRQLGQW